MHSAYNREQGLLGCVFGRYCSDYAVVDGALADQSVAKDGTLLALAVESGVRLLVLFEVPCGRVPNEYMSAVLHVKPVLNRGRLA